MTMEDNSVANDDGFLNELSRSEIRKKLDLVEEIEAHIELIRIKLEGSIQTFLQAPCKMHFSNMAIFEDSLFSDQNPETSSFHLAQIGDEPAACFLIDNDVSRRLLSVALTGVMMDVSDEVILSSAETKLLSVFLDLLAGEVRASMEPNAGMEKQGKTRSVLREEFSEIVENTDWICFYFKLEFMEVEEAFSLILPLSLINGEGRSNNNYQNAQKVDANTAWREALFDHIEDLKMPLLIELGSAEIPISKINKMKKGQSLELNINPEMLEISNDYGQALLLGSLGVSGKQLGFKVKEKAQ